MFKQIRHTVRVLRGINNPMPSVGTQIKETLEQLRQLKPGQNNDKQQSRTR